MKFKSGFTKKLIIILIALIIFNITVPKQVKAIDLGGILMKPIGVLTTTILVSITATVGAFLEGIGGPAGGIASIGKMADAITGHTNLLKGPDDIFAGRVDMLNANFFKAQGSGSGWASSQIDATNLPFQIKKAISSLYIVLRNVSAAIMLAGLIFIGIKILASSNHPQKKAQWVMYLTDWVVGLALLIFMHVMMVGIFYVSDLLTAILNTSMWSSGSMQLDLINQCYSSWDSAVQVISIIMLGYMIWLTIIFSIAYFKRMLWVAVLIVFAPVMAVMYSFGSATKQIFSRWMKDYIMTVMVQPFHMLVYSVLLIIPLNLAGINDGLGSSSSSLFGMIYALGAMTFIKPAERYLRGLFGMDQGLAAMASYDSGVKTLGKIATTVASVTPIGKAASVAMKAASAAAKGGGKAAAAQKVLGALNNDGGAGGAMNNMSQEGITEAQPKNGTSTNALNSWSNSEDYSYGGNEGFFNWDNNTSENTSENTEGNTQKNTEENTEQNQETTVNQNDNNASAVADAVGDSQSALLATLMATDRGSSNVSDINATNVNINAGNINMSKSGKNDNNDNKVGITNPGEDSDSSNTKRRRQGFMLGNFMQVATGQKGIMEQLSEEPRTKLGRGAKTLFTAPYTLGQNFSKMANVQGDRKGAKFVRKLGETGQNTLGKIKHIPNAMANVQGDGRGAKFVRKLGEGGQGVARGIKSIPTFLTEFEKLGGFKELHKGFNEIRDTFDVTGGNGDWKQRNENMGARVKARQEQEKFNFTNTQKNEWLINDFEAKLSVQYPNKNKEYIRNLATEKSKEKLKSLADTYVPLGITDPKFAYECEQDRKEYGYTPEQAIQQRRNYENFNINPQNVEYINNRYEESPGVAGKFTSVSDAMGSSEYARKYYNNGYMKVEDMALVRDLSQALNVSIDKGMQLDQALRRKGGEINYKDAGLSKQQEESLGTILGEYKKIQNTKRNN